MEGKFMLWNKSFILTYKGGGGEEEKKEEEEEEIDSR